MARGKKRGAGFFWGFVLGIALGAALAMLFAPQPGDETREQLADQSEVLRKRGQQRAEALRSQLMERYGDAIMQGKEAYGRAKEEVLTRYSSKAKAAE